MKLSLKNLFNSTDVKSSAGKTASVTEGKTSAVFIRIAYLYLALPIFIFVFGWFRLPLAIISAAAIAFGLFLAMKHAPKTDISFLCLKNLPAIFAAVVIAYVWMYLSGIGCFAYQNFDHMWRNAILETLVYKPWPVIIENSAPYFEHPVTMVYYFALWLPSACFGKLLGLPAAHDFLYCWCLIGVIIVFCLISSLFKKLSLPVILAFIFFSGLDVVGSFIYNNSSDFTWFNSGHLEHWATGFQYSSITTQLFWVFNQAIPAWIITLLLLHMKDNKSIVFVFSFSLMFCTLPAIGMMPLVGYLVVRRSANLYDRTVSFKKNISVLFHDIFTFQNVAAGGIIGITSALFLKTNSSGTTGLEFVEPSLVLMNYIVFIFLECVIYFIPIFKKQSKNGLYYLSFITLLIVPFIRVGSGIDFVMRASIPSLVILFILIMDTMSSLIKEKNRIAATVLGMILAVGGITTYHEIARAIQLTPNKLANPDATAEAQHIDLFEDGMRDNFFGEFEDSLFFKYIAKS